MVTDNMNIGRSKKNKKLFHVMFRTVFVSTVFLVLLALVMLIYVTFRFVLTENGNARISVLEEVSAISKSNRKTMKGIMDLVQNTLEPVLRGDQDDDIIKSRLEAVQTLIDRIGLEANVDVILNAKTVFRTGEETEQSIQTLLNSYWYIKHYSGIIADSWNIRFMSSGQSSVYYLSNGRSVFNDDGTVAGVLVVNTSLQNQVEALSQLASNSDVYYILDENGIVVCHTNAQRVGNWMINIDDFQSKNGFNTSTFTTNNGQFYMLSNYHDSESGWTFVGMQNLSGLIESVLKNFAVYFLIASLVGATVIYRAYLKMRRTLKPLSILTREISEMKAEHLQILMVPDSCYEINILGAAFNRMIEKILELVQNIRDWEAEKRQMEYDFLNAQLSPHFIYNTLLSIKSLMLMQETEKASSMLDGFMDIIHVPKGPDIPFVPLREELNLIAHYIDIMNCRMDKAVRFTSDIADDLLKEEIPRMILQPVVENAFFYGFSEMDDGLVIHVTATESESCLYISVSDNGEGIAPERLHDIRNFDYESDPVHHGVGLKNIRQRLKIIYGPESDVLIESQWGAGACITLCIDRRESFPATEMEKDLLSLGGRL